MRKIALLFSLLVVAAFTLNGQDFTKSTDSDPEAKAILKQLKTKYDAFKTMEAQFTLEIEFPEEEKAVQEGTIARSGNQYRLKIANQTVISDGKTVWVILGNNKEVQISNVVPEEEEEAAMITPQTLFSFYEGNQFIYYLTNEIMENGKVVQQIEFKPTDEYADYSKLRMTIDKNKKEIIRVKAFGKDGSRYTLNLKGMNTNKTFPADYFTFKKEDYPGYYIEDLRN